MARLWRPKLAVLLVVSASGCQLIAGLTERSVGLGACLHNSDCASDQACLFRVCAARCQQDVDCDNARCLDTENGNACVSASEASCVGGGAECPTGSVCSEGSCRTSCDQANPCRSDQVCTEDMVCVGTNKSHDPEAPPSSTGGSGGDGGSSNVGLGGDSGVPADGGSATSGGGGSGTGGSQVAGSGGSAMGGNGGSAMGGNGGSAMGGNGGSMGGAGGDTDPSTGCDAPAILASGVRTVVSSGATRSYTLDVPANYDESTPYRLIIAWHPIGETGAEVAAGTAATLGPYYDLKAEATEGVIFVAPQAIGAAWSNANSDVQFARDLVAELEAGLCIDKSRIFSTGFSLGADMSVTVGCSMGDVFRAVASIGRINSLGCSSTATPVAFWGAHGTADNLLPHGRAARDVFLAANGCVSQTTAVNPSPCVAYQGCNTAYPVHWCEFNGNHVMPTFSGAAIWSFFSQF